MGEYLPILVFAATLYYAYFIVRVLEIGKYSKCPKCVLYISTFALASFLTLALLGYISVGSGSPPPGWCTYYC
jgi:hypothetical protein